MYIYMYIHIYTYTHLCIYAYILHIVISVLSTNEIIDKSTPALFPRIDTSILWQNMLAPIF